MTIFFTLEIAISVIFRRISHLSLYEIWPAWYRCIFILCITLNIFSSAFAGAPNGPYVVWVNLDKSAGKERVDKIIGDFASSSDHCDGLWLRGPMLYMKKRPLLISDALVENVFLKENDVQKDFLNSALKNYKDQELGHFDGLDGIIVYAHTDRTRMMSLTTGRKRKIKSITLALHGNRPVKEDIEDAFCALLPAITRGP